MRTLTRSLGTVALAMGMVLFFTPNAFADGEGECADGLCGTPDESGGGGCGGGSVLIANTDLGDTYQYADDYDEDGFEDDFDNCPFAFNRDQLDSDGDQLGDACDVCQNVYNPEQSDVDGDLLGDACDDDADGDGLENALDNCSLVPNDGQTDTDGDGLGNACDLDDDGDGQSDLTDDCPLLAVALADVADPTLCDEDTDRDGQPDARDNCPGVLNGDQLDADMDGLGDACDADRDGDGIPNTLDNCASAANDAQLDLDRDSLGDACDPHFCYVVDLARPETCLDPTAPFDVSAGADILDVQTGEAVRLRLFANRQNEAIRYRWKVEERPDSSSSVPSHAVGAVTLSTPYEYHYLKDQVATFTADQPGTYRIAVQAELAFADTTTKSTAQSYVTIVAEGGAISADDAVSGGCSTTHGGTTGAGALMLLVGLVGLARRR